MRNPDDIIGLVAVAGTFGSAILAILCVTIYNIIRVMRQTSLKSALVEAGLSVDEIERVLDAGNAKTNPADDEDGKKPPKIAAF